MKAKTAKKTKKTATKKVGMTANKAGKSARKVLAKKVAYKKV